MGRLCVLFACIVVVWPPWIAADGVRPPQRVIGFFHALSEEPASPSPLSVENPSMLETKTTLFEDREVVDFEKREISFERTDKIYNVVVWQYRYDELDAYLESRRHFVLLNAWYKSALTLLSAPSEKKKNPFSALQWELPVQYPAWAQRILGKDPPKLTISGFEKIIVSDNYTKTDIPNSNVQLQGNNALVFDQDNQFSITGSVGRLIGINIKGSTKQAVSADVANNPLKDFKIDYKGEGDELEDEVVQQVTAGFTGFDMPSTVLSGYSESHEGLFGIKIGSKIGPLSLTGIASTEQGESQNTTLNPSGQGQSGTQKSEKDFMRNKLFFLDTVYRNHYIDPTVTVPTVTRLEVWLSNSTILTQAQATNLNKQTSDVYRYVGTAHQVYKLLVQERDYHLDVANGFIRFDSLAVQDNDVLGMYLVTSSSTANSKASQYNLNDNSATDTLAWLKPMDQDSTAPTFPLMWRNVYQMPQGFDPSKFRLRVVTVADTSINKNPQNGRFFSEILGLTDAVGNPLTSNNQVYDADHGLIILPVRFKKSSGGLGNEPFSNDTLGQGNTNRDIYRMHDQDWTNIIAKYQIIMSGSSRKTTFTIGFGAVMSGTDALYMGGKGGTRLDRQVDYTIDYQMGQIDLISKRAQAADQIYVEYQSDALFMPQSKVFLGARGEVKLPIGEKSFIGTSLLWQDASTQDRVPKINQEPYSKLLLDMNTQIDMEPEWMTKAVNLIPLVSTAAKSSVNLEVEVAHSSVNPNTDGSAYIDDFEGSKQSYPLGLSQASWYQSSPPAPWQSSDSLLHHPPAWIQYWYAPLGDSEVLKTEIFAVNPDSINLTQADKYEATMSLVCQPGPPDSARCRTLIPRFQSPWAGIMTYFPAGQTDRSKDKYLEFWARSDAGGRLYVDLGDVSEALSIDGGPPKDSLYNEDPTNTGNLANDTLDIGLDGKQDTSEWYCVPKADFSGWDTLWDYVRDDAATKAAGKNVWLKTNDGKTDSVEHRLPIPGDPSKDNYQTYSWTNTDQRGNYRYVNGTQRNGVLNTEDLNGDGFHTVENFYRRYIDFDSAENNNTKFLAANAGNYMVPDTLANEGKHIAAPYWHLYRVPLNDTTHGLLSKVGSPQWNDMHYVRIWWSNFSPSKMQTTNTIKFAGIQFVGNQWLETPNFLADSVQEVKLAVSTVNTDDNAGSYSPPPGVYRATTAQGNLARESSLDLAYNDIQSGDVALVERSLAFQPLNVSAYSDLSVMFNGDTGRAGFWFFLRFGSDDSTYYEARTPILGGGGSKRSLAWQTMDIHLKDISDMKLLYQIHNGDTVLLNTSVQSGNCILSARAPKGRSPNFANVTWMALGVARDSLGLTGSWRGDIWVDEMKVNGIKTLDGWAGRVYLTTKWADFVNFSLGIDYADGNFRRMTDANIGLGNSQLSANLSLDGKLSKFLPDRWGVDIPLGTRLQESLTRPEIKPSSDIYLLHADGSPDGLMEMYKDAIDMIVGRRVFDPDTTASRHYQTTSFQRDWWTGYAKKTQSPNPFVDMLLDRTAIDFSSSLKASETGKGERTEGGEDVLDKDTLQTYHGTLKYNLTPSLDPKYYKFKPFEKSTLLWLPQRIKNYEFSYLPTTLTFDIAEVTYSKETSIQGEAFDTTVSKKLELDHRMNLVYDPVNILDFSYNLAVTRNLDSAATTTNLQKNWHSFLVNDVAQMDPTWKRYDILYGERSRTQGATLKFDPSFLDWLSHSFDYSANYHENATTLSNDTTKYQNMGVDRTFHLSSTLTLASLFKNLAGGFANFKSMAAVFNSISAAINKISFNSLTFDYSAKASLVNDNMSTNVMQNISREQFYLYQVGLSDRNAWDIVTGNMSDKAFGGMKFRPDLAATLAQNDQRSSDMNLSLSTNFNIPQPIDITFSGISLKWSRNYVVRPDTTATDTTVTWPDFSESAKSGILNKLAFVPRYMQTVTLSQNFSYQQKVHSTATASAKDRSISTAYKLSPLVGFQGVLKKWPITLDYSYSYGWKSDSSSGSSSYSRTIDNSNKVAIKYEVSKSSGVKELKLLMWKIPIVGRLVAGAEGEYTTSTTDSRSSGVAPTTTNTSLVSVTPHASYDFTDNVTGEFKYTGSQNKTTQSTTTSNIFSLSVEIRFNP
jgi:hypothetical protein